MVIQSNIPKVLHPDEASLHHLRVTWHFKRILYTLNKTGHYNFELN